jgi:hypothetical protein
MAYDQRNARFRPVNLDITTRAEFRHLHELLA